jgi:hypothetical protein
VINLADRKGHGRLKERNGKGLLRSC